MDRRTPPEAFPGYVEPNQDPHKSMDVLDAAISARREMLVNMERQSGVFQGQDSRHISYVPDRNSGMLYPLDNRQFGAPYAQDNRHMSGISFVQDRQSGVYQPQERRYSWVDSQSSTPRDRRTMDSTYGNFRVPSHLSIQIPYGTASPAGSFVYSAVDPDEKKYDRYYQDEDLNGLVADGPPQQPAQPPSPPQIAFSTTHEILFIMCVCFAQFLSLAALAQTVSPLLLIGEDLHVTNPGQLSWFTASFSMTLGTFILPAGRIGDIVGHKRVFLIGWLWFALFSLICGFSYVSGPIMLSVARAFQGIGPALLVPNAMALIGRTFPMGMKRNIVFSIFGACGPTGWTTGAVFSALFAQKLWWPYAFFAMTIACTLITVFSFIVIPDALAVRAGPPGSAPPKFDYVGTFFGVSGLILINFALNQAPLVGWQTPYTYFILIIGILVTGFFIVVELHTDHPLIPIKDLQPSAAFALSCIAAGWASHGIWIYYLNLFLMRLRHVTPLLAQAQTCLVAITGTMFALSTGFLLNHIHVSTLMFLAMTVFCIGTALIAFMPVNQTYWAQTFISCLVMPAGMNWSFPAGTILLSNAMPKEMQGKAASLVATVVNYAIATGLGFAGTTERYINDTGDKVLQSYRGAWYLGMGMAGLGMAISAVFIYRSVQEQKMAKAPPPLRNISVGRRRSHKSNQPVV